MLDVSADTLMGNSEKETVRKNDQWQNSSAGEKKNLRDVRSVQATVLNIFMASFIH